MWSVVVRSVQVGPVFWQQSVTGAGSGGSGTHAPAVVSISGGGLGHGSVPPAILPIMKVPPSDGGQTMFCIVMRVKGMTPVEHAASSEPYWQQADRRRKQFDSQMLSPSHCSPGSITPLPQSPASVVVVALVVVDVIVTHRQSSPHSGPKRWPGSGGHWSGFRLHGGSHCSLRSG